MPASGSSEGGSTGIPAFRALRYRNFRLLWGGLAISAVGTWMAIVAQSLLVLDLTHGSAVYLGAISLVQAVAFLLFAPLGGSLADHFDKRRLLAVTQTLMMLLTIVLGVLTATGAIRFWMIPPIVFASASALSFDQPARNALVASLVPKDVMLNAISLQSAVFNGASLLGPALAGLTLSRFGYSANFFLNAASFFAVLGALYFLNPKEVAAIPRPQGGLLRAVAEALHFIRRDAVLPSVISAYSALMFLGPSVILMVPLFTRQVVHGGPTELGLLFSAIGAGTVTGALSVASLGDPQHKDRLALGAMFLWTLALAAFGWSASLWIAVPALFFLGVLQNAAGATTMTLLQARVPPEMRGRAMSLNTLLMMCVRPLGDFPAGAVMGWLGFRNAVVLSAGLVAAAVLAVAVTRGIRR
ncbi:MAG TPA: MFS transporter [Bryobacteraceae bacterium]|nr:MFS transporter [Bryobacteraceae bacterium]